MRSVFIVAFLAFFIVGGGGFIISWYGQATTTKTAIEQAIAQINEKEKLISYEAIETSGFPSNVYVSIVKPHFKGRIDQFFKDGNIVTEPGKPALEWNEDAALDGKIIVGVSAFSDKYSLAVNGNWTENSTINGQTVSSIHKQTGDFSCNLQFQRDTGIFDTLWNFQALDRDGKTLAKNFRLLDCNSAGQKAFDATTQGILSSIGPMRLYVTSTPEATSQKIRFYFETTDMEVTPLGDMQLASYYHAMSPGYDLPLNFSSYGKQNIAVDFSYTGPSDWQIDNQNPTIDIALNKMDISNQIYNTHTALHLYNTPVGNMRTSAIAFRSEAEFSEQYDTLVKAISHSFIKRFYTSNDPRFQEAKALAQKYSLDELYGIIDPSLPSFHAMGKILLALDGSFKGNATSPAGDYTLDQLQISTTPYGINGKGNIKVATNLPSEGNLQLNCINCLKMLDDMFDYSTRIQKTISYFNPEKAKGMSIDPALFDGIKKFLAALSAPPKDPADQGNFAFNIISSGTGMTINGKPMNEIAALYNQYIRPTLKQPAAPVILH